MILINVLVTNSDHARKQITKKLDVAQNVLNESLKNREELLYSSASVLAADFGFKQAVATKDRNTISSALSNHGARIAADLMVLVSFEHQVIASIPNILPVDSSFSHPDLLEEVIRSGGAATLLVHRGSLYQIIMLTVDAPAPIAVVLIGFELNDEFAGQLKNITQLEITIQAFSENREVFLVSSLSKEQQSEALSDQARSFSWISLLPFESQSFFSQALDLSDHWGLKVVVTLTDNMEELLFSFNKLQLNIIAIAITAIILAMLSAAILSKRMTKPLTVLSEVALDISKGNYRQAINNQSKNKELNYLSNAFSSMQIGIRRREKEIVYQARHDVLTNLNNRSYASYLLEQRFKRTESFQAVGINVHGFRRINDVFGYSTGDGCLTVLADRVRELGGMTARLTGGELLWVPQKPMSIIEIQKIKNQLENKVEIGGVQIEFSVLIAVLNCPEDASSAEEMFRRMNIVLDEAEVSTDFILTYKNELEQRYLNRLAIITELKLALTDRQHELSLFYQPKLELDTGKVQAVEGLIRWNNKRLGVVRPDEFIIVAEGAGLIEEITDWVISRAILDLSTFREIVPKMTIAINLSAKDVLNSDLLTKVCSLLKKNRLPPNALSFEVTESDLVEDVEKASRHLSKFREDGFSIAIDDFGTGYSSMAYLKRLPVTALKVDKSFVLNLSSEKEDQKIVQMIIGLAHSFELKVIAEGVENLDSLKLLRGWGCELAQGYYIAKPMNREKLLEWLPENETKNWWERE